MVCRYEVGLIGRYGGRYDKMYISSHLGRWVPAGVRRLLL
jgi:predicted MPP superfamily phosphohydrolase